MRNAIAFGRAGVRSGVRWVEYGEVSVFGFFRFFPHQFHFFPISSHRILDTMPISFSCTYFTTSLLPISIDYMFSCSHCTSSYLPRSYFDFLKYFFAYFISFSISVPSSSNVALYFTGNVASPSQLSTSSSGNHSYTSPVNNSFT